MGQVWLRNCWGAGGPLLIPKVMEAVLGPSLRFSDSVTVFKAHQEEPVSVGSALGAKPAPRGLVGKRTPCQAFGSSEGLSAWAFCFPGFLCLVPGHAASSPNGEAISVDGLCGCGCRGQA